MYTKYFTYTFLAFFTSIATWAQFQLKTQVSSQSMGINQVLEVRFVMTGDADDFKRPAFENFEVVGGPMQSISHSWVNGKTSMEKSVSFFVQPKKKGTLTIGSASVVFEDKVYKSQPVTIQVGDAVQEQPRQQQRRRDPFSIFDEMEEEFFRRQRQQQPQLPKNMGEGIHLVAKVSKSSAYVNEPITIEYGLYVSDRAGFNTMNVKQMPKYENFWNHMIEEKQMQVTRAELNGKSYRYLPLQKAVLLPQKDGTLRIDPLEIELEEQYFTGNVDVFGAPELGLRKKTYSSGAKTIQVKPLPLDKQPEGYTGAVGSFNFKVQANKTSLKANEPLELTVTVQGKGNLDLLTLPKPVAPNALELYDPEKINKVSKSISAGMEGTKTEKYVIVPQYKGTYTIEPLTFSYFDTASKSYKTITSDSLTIEVTEGPELPTNTPANTKAEVVSKQEMQPLNGNIEWFNGNFITQSKSFYAWWLAPLLLLPTVFAAKNIRDKKAGDVTGNKLKTSNKLAKKYLSEAKKQIGNKEAFYEALERCLHNYLKARLKIETSELSNDTITKLLSDNGINQEDISTFLSIKTTCEMARYAQMDIQTMQNDYDLAVQLISSIDKQIKK
ncbi:Oxygen tolerance [Paenimyroides aquimaris]|uniref:Oxygen tolerance n=1 Tax=Paenimyroides marinum TaxID=1159016 RepID=A0A1H6JHA7_9FLAO|nr:BatD family protein [Paenimyroides aquimaris]SEH61705.1 Oxygen tolerance [Paenimyroides aquimaris]